MADIKTLAEKMMRDSWATGDDAAWHPARDALHAALDALAEAHQAEVARLTRERDELNDARNAAIERCNFMHSSTREAQEFAAQAQEQARRLTNEAENVRRKWLGHRDTGHLSLVEAADHVVGGLHADIDRLTRENEGLAKAARGVCEHIHGELPRTGYLRDNDNSRAALGRLRAALAGASGAQEGERT